MQIQRGFIFLPCCRDTLIDIILDRKNLNIFIFNSHLKWLQLETFTGFSFSQIYMSGRTLICSPTGDKISGARNHSSGGNNAG